MAMAEVWDVQQLKLTWETRRNAPWRMRRGAAAAHGSVGYFSSVYSHDVFAYNSEKDDWSELPECPQRDFGLAVINNLLTAVGGEPSGLFSYTNRLVSFNGSKWVTIFPPMPTKRCWPAVISAQNYLIAAGGVRGVAKTLSTVEVMNTATREWYTAASLPEPVCWMSATVCGGRLYLLGGLDKYINPTQVVFTCTLDSLLHSCHQPSQTPPHTNEAGVWQRIADVPMTYSTCTTLNGRVLAVGGRDSHGTSTTDVYMYNANSWIIVGHKSTARNLCLVVGLRDCIIAVGGCILHYTVGGYTSSVEVGYLQLSGGCMVTSLTIHTQPTNLCVVLKVIHAGGWLGLARETR